MNRLNRLHAEQQEVCSSIWGQQLRRRGHQTESSSVLQEDRIYPSIKVVDPKQTNVSPYNSRADTQAQPHEATCRPVSSIRRETGRQCRTSRRSGVTCSYFLWLHSSLAAALRTDCRQSRRHLCAPTSKLLQLLTCDVTKAATAALAASKG